MSYETEENIKKLLKLPIGIQTFEKLRTEGYLYVDKTKYLIDLIDSGTVFFLSRPAYGYEQDGHHQYRKRTGGFYLWSG